MHLHVSVCSALGRPWSCTALRKCAPIQWMTDPNEYPHYLVLQSPRGQLPWLLATACTLRLGPLLPPGLVGRLPNISGSMAALFSGQQPVRYLWKPPPVPFRGIEPRRSQLDCTTRTRHIRMEGESITSSAGMGLGFALD